MLLVISRTRQRVRNSTLARSACGQYVISTLAFAPCAQPERALAQVDALGATVVVRRRHCHLGWPPVPAKFVERLRAAGAGPAERHRRHGGLVRGIRRIAGKASDAHHAIVLHEIRLQRPIVDRPVVRDAIKRPQPEIGRMHAREMRHVEDRSAADAVEVCDLHCGAGVVDGIVSVARATVRADVEIGVAARFPVGARGGQLGRLDPVALLKTKDLHACLGKAPGHGGARGAGADDENVDDGVRRAGGASIIRGRHAQRPLSLTSRHIGGRSRTGSSSDQSP